MKIPRRLRVVPIKGEDRTLHKIFVDEDEFPWPTKVGSLKVEPAVIEGKPTGAQWVTVTILVNGEVEVPDSYISE